MTAYKNGQVPDDALRAIATTHLAKGTANAFARAINECKKHGVTLSAWGENAGYRDLAMQTAMRHAFVARDLAAMRRLGMDTSSKATPAAPGYSYHGLGLAVDIKASDPAMARAIMRQWGFSWPFGYNDVNHMLHDGKTGTGPLLTIGKLRPRKVYTIRPGDTLGVIARKNKISLAKLVKLNPAIHNLNVIKVGQKIYLS